MFGRVECGEQARVFADVVSLREGVWKPAPGAPPLVGGQDGELIDLAERHAGRERHVTWVVTGLGHP